MRRFLNKLLGVAAGVVGAAALAACPRQVPPEVAEQRRLADARYPWQQPSWQRQAEREAAPAAGDGEIAGAVELPSDLGRHPALGATDTLAVEALPGDWLLTCLVDQEDLVRREPDNFYMFRFAAGGSLTFLPIVDGKLARTVAGTWEKTGPGKLLMSIDQALPLTYYCEMFGTDFLYMWTFDTKNGLWLARKPAQHTTLIEGNDFLFTSGEHLRLTNVKGIVYNGYIDGPTRKEVSGGYNQGVLNMRWVDAESNAEGFAMFIVSPDWKALRGVWWLNDYESAPFGGTWQTEAVPAAPTAAPAPSSAAGDQLAGRGLTAAAQGARS